ncbi:hypothetical protein [Curtobacterium flaccumfaciens]|uniref:hypothetical protein n=1 Tax=Curtobacterium flaccumfaciens TaxID=2035 RepID=UPI0012E084B2|nr:hypothetical protein [Curtobacterium flaccumfaciens]
MDEHDLTERQKELLALLPQDGATVGQIKLQDQLGWSDEYWAIRDSLEDKGLVKRGRGRGGTLSRVLQVPDVETVTIPVAEDAAIQGQSAADALRREGELYDPIARVLRGDWSRDRRTQPLEIEITAHQGARATGGRWSRPDLVWVSVRTFQFLPQKVLEVITFEVKPADAIDVLAVYEALAHRRAATHSYVVLDVPTDKAASVEEDIQAVRDVARSHGVGLIVFGDPEDYSTWEVLEDAQRVEPDPERLESFIDTQLSDMTKRSISQATR